MGDFGINLPTTEQIPLARTCGSISGRDCADKYAEAGIPPFDSTEIESKLIEECPLNIECQVVHKIDYPGTHVWFVGEIKALHIDEDYDPANALMFWGKHYRRVGEILEPAF